MAIATTDIKYRYSVVTASAGDAVAGTAAGSLGDQVATTEIPAATLNSLFADAAGAESAAGSIKYRCIFVLNNHATLTYLNATVTLTGQTAGGGTVDVATDNIGPVAKGSASAQAATIANETTAPTGVSAFGAGPLALGDIGPGQVKAIWLRRTITAGAAATDPDNLTIRCNGDTGP